MFVDKTGKSTFVCPLCYEAGHKRKDCPKKVDDPIRRCFKCNGFGHFKIDCPTGKLKGDALKQWKVFNESGLVEGSTKPCFRCNEEGHLKVDCPKGEDTTLRCFKCNSYGHIKVPCPLSKRNLNMDKDKLKETLNGNMVVLDANVLVSSKEGNANEDDLSKSTTVVDEDENAKLVEYSKVDEINLEGFCLMVESTRQEKSCEKDGVEKSSELMLWKTSGKFIKSDTTTKSQDGASSVAIIENVGWITRVPQSREEGNAEGSSLSEHCASDTSYSTKKSKVNSTLSANDIRKMCENNFDNIHDAYDYLVEYIAENNPWVVQVKKERRQLRRELSIVKSELQKWTYLSQAKNGVVDNVDGFSSKSLDMSIDRSKNIVARLEPKNYNVACD